MFDRVPPQLLQFAGSLGAILLLVLIARWLGLGGTARQLDSDDAVRAALDHVAPGFEPVALARSADGDGAAIARDSEGRVLVLRAHGVHLAGRVLGRGAKADMKDDLLIVDTGERRFGTVALRVADPSAWIQAIATIGGETHARL